MDISQLERAAEVCETEGFEDLASAVRMAAGYIKADKRLASRRLDQFFQAALTGLLARPVRRRFRYEELVDKARTYAKLAAESAPPQVVGEDS